MASSAVHGQDLSVERKGITSLATSYRLARAFGWFSLGLGVAELVMPGRITEALGLDGKDGLIRAYGVREIAAGVTTLAVDKPVGLVSRVAGDGLDLATLGTALARDNPKRGNAMIATAAVAAITLLDIAATIGLLSTPKSRSQ